MGLKKKERHPLRKIKELFRKVGTLNLILIIVGAFFVWFNWQMLCIYREYASIPETYACAVIAATIGECGICGWIRTNKDKNRDHKWEIEDKKNSQGKVESEENANG
jgi:hypothetical protein